MVVTQKRYKILSFIFQYLEANFFIKTVVPIDITVGTACPDELDPEMFVDLGLSVETQKTIVRKRRKITQPCQLGSLED